MNSQPQNNNLPTNTSNNETTSQHKTMAMLIYILGIFFPILAPLIIWALMKDESELIDKCGKEALNFHISFLIYFIISLLLTVILIGFPLIIALSVAALVLNIIAGIQAYEAKVYRVPLTIRFIT